MMRYPKALVLLLAAGSALSCKAGESKSAVSTSGNARSDVAQAAGPLDACALMLKADVDAAFAPRVFGDGEKGVGDVAGSATLAAVSGCTFSSPGASAKEMMTVSILARRAPDDQTGMTVAMAKDGAVQLNATPVDVPGLGEAAYWINLGSSTRPIIQLNVLKGKRLWLIFSATASPLGTDTALAGLAQVARAALGRL